MKRFALKSVAAALMLAVVGANAATVPFTETFAADSANWFNSAGNGALNWSAAGGPGNSSHASGGFNFATSAANDTPVIFRAQDDFNSSGNAFVGDWIAQGVTQFSMQVRHNATQPLNFFARFSGPSNFPGATAVFFQPVLPGQWTTLSLALEATNPQFISFESLNFNAVFGANSFNGFVGIGHIQIGVSVPTGLAGLNQGFSFDIDNVSIVPEPSALALLAVGALAAVRRR
ncbi:MAG: PEP-CTERM sorting domain-containing protein [Phycisphaerae bacterium]|nr:PEP-CTERM sorting domain-containing protein [Phycisphaerae bacterium]